MTGPARVPTNNYVAHYDPAKAHHRAWLQAVLDRLTSLEPGALQEGGELRDLWKAAVETKASAPDAVALALPLIKEFEGCELTAYPDPGTGGEPFTIGWGSTTYASGSRVKPGDTISQESADALLVIRVRRDALQIAKAIPTWASMTPQQQAALLSFTYNVGPNWYGDAGFKTITARVMDAQFDRVPEALLLYVNPGTAVEAGLRRRREAEGRLWRQGSTPAGPPKLQVPPQQPAKPKLLLPPHLTLTRTNKLDSRGLELLKLQEVVNGIPMGHLLVISGAPHKQSFRRGRDSKAGSLEPLPEGRYGVGKIEWKTGRDSYAGSFGEGLGPVWVSIDYQAPGETDRSALGIHLDENQSRVPGTAGCIGLRSIADLKRLVTMLRAHDPKQLYVDWQLGTCPPVRPA